MGIESILANSQLAASPATIYTSTFYRQVVDVVLQNTSGSLTETVLVTVTPAGGSASQVARVVLAPNEQATVSGIAVSTGDAVGASASDATTVDYVVFAGTGPFVMQTFDATGALKQVNSGVSGNQTIGGVLTITGGETLGIGASTAAAGTTHTDATALPAGTAPVYPTTGANDSAGVIITTADKVTGRTLFIGNGVSNKILKVYAPSGGVINGGSADAAFSSVSGSGVIITCLSGSGNTWLAWS